MKLVTFLHDGAARSGRLDGDAVVDLAAAGLPGSTSALLAGGTEMLARAGAADGPRHALDAVTLLAPVLRPPKILAVGLNYRDPRENALEWLQRFGDPYAFHLADEPGRVAIDFGVYAAPETFVIDARGIIRFKHIGALTMEIVEQEILPLVEQMEAEG